MPKHHGDKSRRTGFYVEFVRGSWAKDGDKPTEFFKGPGTYYGSITEAQAVELDRIVHEFIDGKTTQCGCTESYPQLIPGKVSHGPGCTFAASHVAQNDIASENAFVNGARFGWNCGITEDREKFDQAIERRNAEILAASAPSTTPRSGETPHTEALRYLCRTCIPSSMEAMEKALDACAEMELEVLSRCKEAIAMTGLLAKARAERDSALSATPRSEERAWLIEMPSARWGTGFCWKGVTEYGTWGTIGEAVRFSRKEDADRVIESLHTEDKRRYGYRHEEKYEACEHIWMRTADGGKQT